ncbi:MAG: hypothetical protein ACRDQ1_03985, partial [Sciscionella sp.]
MSGHDIYNNFHQGPGPEGLSAGAEEVNSLVPRYNDLGERIKALQSKIEASWSGDAAGAASRGAGPLAVEYLEAAPQLNHAQNLVQDQAHAFSTAKNSVVPVAPQGPPAPSGLTKFAAFFGVSGAQKSIDDYGAKQAAFNEANAHNNTVMQSYTSTSSYNGSNLPKSYGTILNDQAGISVNTNPASSSTGPGGTGGPTYSGGGSGGGNQNYSTAGNTGGGYHSAAAYTAPAGTGGGHASGGNQAGGNQAGGVRYTAPATVARGSTGAAGVSPGSYTAPGSYTGPGYTQPGGTTAAGANPGQPGGYGEPGGFGTAGGFGGADRNRRSAGGSPASGEGVGAMP